LLDSIAWSGNNSTSESLEHGVPIVALRGRFMRGRHSSAILERMGVTETIAESLDDYVSIAIRLGREIPWRNDVRWRVAERKHRIYRDKDSIAALEDFLERVARGGS
jgi:predicted O-linked N-acetylglucosamine transferase (SPINDLY family)